MIVLHAEGTATLLPSGDVMVAGGYDGSTQTSETELYSATAGSWTQTGSMNYPREAQTASLLRNGKVLVAGGANSEIFHDFDALTSAEIYDPVSNTWTVTGAMNVRRLAHAATTLNDGRVLVSGGALEFYSPGPVTNACEIYDPATGAWTLTGFMMTNRSFHSATLLPNGKVLVAGGTDDNSSFSSAEVFDPTMGTWTATSNSMAYGRFGHSATLLPNGKVLVIGGYNAAENTTLGSGELYDPATSTWTLIENVMSDTRYHHTTTLLPDGQLLIAGGLSFVSNGVLWLAEAELYDGGLGFSNSWQPQIAAITSPFSLGGAITVTGNGYRGVSGASYGDGQDSATDYPLVQLLALESGESLFLQTTNWSTNTFVSMPVTNFPAGYALATVFVNGIPSTSSLISLNVPVPVPTVLTNAQRLANGVFEFKFTNSPGALFGVLATTNVALPLTNWTALGGVTEVMLGQFEFADAQAANSGRRFYRLRAP
jgi:hypothetical protein